MLLSDYLITNIMSYLTYNSLSEADMSNYVSYMISDTQHTMHYIAQVDSNVTCMILLCLDTLSLGTLA